MFFNNNLYLETSLEKWYSDDSDSDQDTGVMDKLAKAVTHLISEYIKLNIYIYIIYMYYCYF